MKSRNLLSSLIIISTVAIGGAAITALSGTTPALGLDLQGGVSVTQEPVGEYTQAGLDLAVERIRERVDALGVAEPEILRQGDAIVANLPGVQDQQRAIDLVQVTGKVYLRPVLQCGQTANPNFTTTTVDPSAPTSSTSLAPGETAPATTPDTASIGSTPTASPPADSTPADSTPADSTPDSSVPATEPIDTTPPTVLPPPTTQPGDVAPSDPAQQAFLLTRADDDEPVTEFCQVGPTLLDAEGQPLSTGEVFGTDSSVQFQADGGWTVSVDLRDGDKGADVWNQLAALCFQGQSEQCPSGRLAIELDGEIISAPSVNQTNFTSGVDITVGDDKQLADELAKVLESGSLPVELRTQAVQTVSPTLGKDSLRAALVAGLVGVLLVLLLMILYYRTLGFVVACGLIVSGSLIWTIISLLSKVQGLALSLSGVAGIIVSVGVTVDSYVVFFERLKDEIRAGKTLRNSAQRGFVAAWRTILIADLVSILGASVLWFLTVGSVRNFAFFLGLSTIIDLVVSYCFTRPAVLLAARGALGRRNVLGLNSTGAAS